MTCCGPCSPPPCIYSGVSTWLSGFQVAFFFFLSFFFCKRLHGTRHLHTYTQIQFLYRKDYTEADDLPSGDNSIWFRCQVRRSWELSIYRLPPYTANRAGVGNNGESVVPNTRGLVPMNESVQVHVVPVLVEIRVGRILGMRQKTERRTDPIPPASSLSFWNLVMSCDWWMIDPTENYNTEGPWSFLRRGPFFPYL